MYTLKIKVTKEILERSKMCGSGNLNPSQNCAIALAVRDIFPDATIGVECIHVGRVIWLPMEAQKFIERFDRIGPLERLRMEEIEFEVKVPDEVINQINIEELRPLLENHPTLQLTTNN